MLPDSKQKKRFSSGILFLAILCLVLSSKQWLVWAQQAFDPDSTVLPIVAKDQVTHEDILTLNDSATTKQRKANVLFLLDTSGSMVFTADAVTNPDGPDIWTPETYAGNNPTFTYGQGGHNSYLYTFDAPDWSGGPAGFYSVPLAGVDKDASNNTPGNKDHYYSPDPARPYLLTFKNEKKANRATLPAYTKDDLMPNDSRMYKMFLVFNRLLDEEKATLDRMRFGLATSYAAVTTTTDGSQPEALDAYYYGDDEAENYGGAYMAQRRVFDTMSVPISKSKSADIWHTRNRAYLRVPFGENTAEHVKKVRMLMDGSDDARPGGTNDPFYFKNPEITVTGVNMMPAAIFMEDGDAPAGSTKWRDHLLHKQEIIYSNRTDGTAVQQYIGRWDRPAYLYFQKNSGEAMGGVLDFFSPPVKGLGAPATASWKTTGGPNAGKTYTVHDAPSVNFPIRDFCEPNWLVVFTAGDRSTTTDKGFNSSLAASINHLYQYTKNNDVVRIKDPNLPPVLSNLESGRLAQPIRTLVIGFVDPTHPALKDLREDLQKAADIGWDGVENGVGEAHFANDIPGLMAAIRNITKVIVNEIPERNISSSSALLAPAGADTEGFQTSFTPSSTDQWEADFKYFSVKSKIMTLEYSLQEELSKAAKTKPLARKVYSFRLRDRTIQQLVSGKEFEFFKYSDINNQKRMNPFNDDATFAPMKKEEAATLMGRWLLGEDYDSTQKKSFPRKTLLADTGQSGYTLMKEIDPAHIHEQQGYETWLSTPAIKNRPKTLFFQTNDGLLHAIDPILSADQSKLWGRERWAFIPPNVLVGQRLLGLKFKIDHTAINNGTEYKQKASWISSAFVSGTDLTKNTYRSNASYTTDGPVYLYNLPYFTADKFSGTVAPPDWKTILVASTGRGGAGLYAMDVTSPQTLNNDSFLWAVENNLSLYNTQRKGSPHWGEVHTWSNTYIQNDKYVVTKYDETTRADFDRLGFNIPAPLVGTTKGSFGYSYFQRNGSGWGGSMTTTVINDLPISVAVIAGGMQYDLNLNENGVFGSALYIIDPVGIGYDASASAYMSKPLSIFRAFTNDDSESTILHYDTYASQGKTHNPIMGMMLTPPAAISQIDGGKYLTGFVTADNRGQIFEGRFIGKNAKDGKPIEAQDHWTLQRIGTIRIPSTEQGADDNFPIPYPMSVASTRANPTDIWVWGGTADVRARNIGEDLVNQSPRKGVIERKKGKEHYLFGFKRSDAGALELRSSTQVDSLNPLLRNDVIDTSKKSGWIIPLEKDTATRQREYTSARTVLVNANLFAATFLPGVISGGGSSACDDVEFIKDGDTHLYWLDPQSAQGKWPERITPAKYVTYKGIKTSGMNLIFEKNGDARLYMSVTIVDKDRFQKYAGQSNAKLNFADSPHYAETGATLHNPGLMSLSIAGLGGSGGSQNYPKKHAGKLNYWREMF